MKVGKHVLRFLKEYKEITAKLVATTALIGIEELLELGYNCPPAKHLRIVYISLYFLIPAVILLILAWYAEVHIFNLSTSTRICSFRIFWQASLPSVFWIVVLFLDGKYFHCAYRAAKENTTRGYTPEDDYVLSQIIGMVILLVVAIAFFFTVLCSTRNPGEAQQPLEATEMSQKTHTFEGGGGGREED